MLRTASGGRGGERSWTTLQKLPWRYALNTIFLGQGSSITLRILKKGLWPSRNEYTCSGTSKTQKFLHTSEHIGIIERAILYTCVTLHGYTVIRTHIGPWKVTIRKRIIFTPPFEQWQEFITAWSVCPYDQSTQPRGRARSFTSHQEIRATTGAKRDSPKNRTLINLRFDPLQSIQRASKVGNSMTM